LDLTLKLNLRESFFIAFHITFYLLSPRGEDYVPHCRTATSRHSYLLEKQGGTLFMNHGIRDAQGGSEGEIISTLTPSLSRQQERGSCVIFCIQGEKPTREIY
jgi:hypothetical protein